MTLARSTIFVLALVASVAACGEASITGWDEEGNDLVSVEVKGNLYHNEFDTASWANGWSSSAQPVRVSTGYTGSALRTRIAKGAHYGANMSRFVHQSEEMYFRYYLKFGSNWSPAITGKLPGPADLNGTDRCKGGKKPNSAECWSARMMWRPIGATTTDIGYYLYHADQPGVYGDGFGVTSDPYALRFKAEGYTPLARDTWYCIEGYVKMNTPGQKDGVLKGWVNGRPAQERSDIRFRDSTALNIERLWFDIYYGGKDSSNTTQDVYLDRMSLSSKRVGCDSKASDPMWEPGAEDEVFKDMPPNSFAYSQAKALKALGITQGCRSGANPMFCPRMTLTRSQMAAFFTRALNLPASSSDYFDDDEASIYEDNHNRLYEAGITQGCGTRSFCGEQAVTRGQMAAFISRGFSLPATGNDFFADDDNSLFEDAINQMMESGISSGCSSTSFCADKEITRAEMAIFLIRALDL